jgi:nucleotide-binding universal stress UspA family protein
MAWKTIQCFVTDMARDKVALEAAITLAIREGSHLDVCCLGIDATEPAAWYTGVHALALPIALEDAARQAASQETLVRERLRREDLPWAVSALTSPLIGLSQLVGDTARFADLVVAARPYGPGRTIADESIVEAVLFNARTALLVVPEAETPWLSGNPDRVVMAWNDSPEALQTARAALDWMGSAGQVNIVIVEPHVHSVDRSDPGGRISQMLTRHGAKVEVSVLPKTVPEVADTLLRHAQDQSADLLVMGAYGHSRLREAVLGGATRHILERTSLPVLMKH